MAKNFYYPPQTFATPPPPPTGSATAANQVLEINQLTDINVNTANTDTNTAAIAASTNSIDNTLLSRLSGSLVPDAYDEIDLTYVASGNGIGQIETATYKLASSTVKTLTLTYDGSDRLSSVVAS